MEGVAEPSTTLAPCMDAICTAVSLAWYFGMDSLL